MAPLGIQNITIPFPSLLLPSLSFSLCLSFLPSHALSFYSFFRLSNYIFPPIFLSHTNASKAIDITKYPFLPFLFFSSLSLSGWNYISIHQYLLSLSNINIHKTITIQNTNPSCFFLLFLPIFLYISASLSFSFSLYLYIFQTISIKLYLLGLSTYYPYNHPSVFVAFL